MRLIYWLFFFAVCSKWLEIMVPFITIGVIKFVICPRQLFVIVCCCLWFLLRMVVWCCFQTVESITPTLNEISNNVLYHEHKSTFGNDTAQTISCSPESSMMKENVAPVWFKVWLRWQIFLRGALWWELNCLNLRKKIKGSDESCH